MSQREGAWYQLDDGYESYSSYYDNGGGGNNGNDSNDGKGGNDGNDGNDGNSEPDVQDPLCNISQLKGMPASPLLIEELKRVRKKLEEQFDVQRNFNARIERQLAIYQHLVYEPCQLTYVDE